MTIATVASINLCLASAQGTDIKIRRSVRISSTVENRYVVPSITYPGRARWVATTVSSSASAIAVAIKAKM